MPTFFLGVISWLFLYGAFTGIMRYIDGKWADRVLIKRQEEIEAADDADSKERNSC